MIHLTDYLFLLASLLGAVSTVLTNAMVHFKAPAQLKAAVMLFWTLVAGAITTAVQAHGSFTWHEFLTASAVAFAAGVSTHKSQILSFITGPDGLLTSTVGHLGIGAPSDPAAVKVKNDEGQITLQDLAYLAVIIVAIAVVVYLF